MATPGAQQGDVFDDVVATSGAFLVAAAVAAAAELGVFAALAAEALPLAALGARVAPGARLHRLRALTDVLVAVGALGRSPAGLVLGVGQGMDPAPTPIARAGWGLLAEVIRRDRALPASELDLAGYHAALARDGAAAAAELAARLPAGALLDLGGGQGTYVAAFLDAHPTATATLVDRAEVVALARPALARFGARARCVVGDAATVALGADHDVALLANVLHLHGAAAAAALCSAAAGAVVAGGHVVVKDLRVDDARRGPWPGLLFALNMALYTDAGDVHPPSAIAGWLGEAGLGDVAATTLARAPDGIVVTGRRPRGAAAIFAATTGRAAAAPSIAAELDATLAATIDDAWQGHAAPRPALALPPTLRVVLAHAIAEDRAGDGAVAAALVAHYAERLPRRRVAELVRADDPVAPWLAAPLPWASLPRLTAALDRLVAVLVDAGVEPRAALGAASADALRAEAPTLGALYARTHYGRAVPLLYGGPAELARVAARAAARGLSPAAAIDRYLTAPLVHELCHLAPERLALAPPHLDECVAGWLGVEVHPELAYPAPGEDDGLYAAPYLAQIGQAFARGFGRRALVRAHAGAAPWDAALPSAAVEAMIRLGWDDWRARRTVHLLSDTFAPTPWVALALAGAARWPLAGATLAELARLPLAALADALPADPDADRAIVADGLRAMCLATVRDGEVFATRTALPPRPIAVAAAAARITRPAEDGAIDPRPPSYWLPPAVAARLGDRGIAGYALVLGDVAAIADAAAAIAAGSAGCERAGFALRVVGGVAADFP